MSLGQYLNTVVRSVPARPNQKMVLPAVWATDASSVQGDFVVHVHAGAEAIVRQILAQMNLVIHVVAVPEPDPEKIPTTFELDEEAARTTRVPKLREEWFAS